MKRVISVALIAIIGLFILTGCAAYPYERPTIEEPESNIEVEQSPVVSQKQTHEHDLIRIFAFQPSGSTAASYTKQICKTCDNTVGYLYSLFRGTPSDTSYLDVIKAHSDSDENLWGEYFTMTATVSLCDYDMQRVRIHCVAENKTTRAFFSVEFLQEYEEAVASLNEGDIITFRGRFGDTGCEFTECELLEVRK